MGLIWIWISPPFPFRDFFIYFYPLEAYSILGKSDAMIFLENLDMYRGSIIKKRFIQRNGFIEVELASFSVF